MDRPRRTMGLPVRRGRTIRDLSHLACASRLVLRGVDLFFLERFDLIRFNIQLGILPIAGGQSRLLAQA